MRSHSLPLSLLATLVALAGLSSWLVSSASAQDDQLVKAMGIQPKYSDELTFEQPPADELGAFEFKRITDPSGFVVHHNSGRMLRRFIDANGDGKLDQWSYFNDGIEVYRDIDANGDGKLDQYRWLGSAGTKWGLDSNQDGKIDSWKVISPEEVAFECFMAIKNRDTARFDRLLLTEAEFKELGLNESIGADVLARWKQAKSDFAGMASGQKAIDAKAVWVYAGNGQPGMVAADGGNEKDLVVYDHASGFFESGDVKQLALGSVVQVGDVWRMIELPEVVEPTKPLANGGAFFPIPEFGIAGAANPGDARLAKLYSELADIEEKLGTAKDAQIAKLEQAKAELLAQFVTATSDPANKRNWIENLADSVSSAYQADRFPDGMDFLVKFIKDNPGVEGNDYVQWRAIFAEYGWVNTNGERQQRDAAQDRLIEQLEEFQKDFPKSEFAADALIQLGVNNEVTSADEPEKALKWYQACVERFPETKYGVRAKGAITRLNGLDKTFDFVGKTAAGKPFDIKSAKGKIVVLHFWETWCCSDDDLDQLAMLQSKYKDDLVIVGCNIEGLQAGTAEEATGTFNEFVKQHAKTMTWLQLHEPGSVDGSNLAHQLGIATEPMIALVNQDGKLVDSNIAISVLDREIERERRE